MNEIKLEKRYPHSRTEDITDAFIRGYEQGRVHWTSVLTELHERFDALEKELRQASAEMSAVIREYVGRPKGKWKAKSFHECFCDNCGFTFDIMKCDFLENMKFCPNCGADMRPKGE